MGAPRQNLAPWRTMWLAVLFVSWLPISTTAQETLHDAQQQAIYLRNIFGFVQWPASIEGCGSPDLQLCVEGDTLLAFALSTEFRAARLDHRKVEVRTLTAERELHGCTVLVLGRLDRKKVARILAVASGTQVMTFGQTDGFLEAGGTVQIIREEGAFRFAVNLTAMKNTGEKLDARLLEMAKRILQNGNAAGG